MSRKRNKNEVLRDDELLRYFEELSSSDRKSLEGFSASESKYKPERSTSDSKTNSESDQNGYASAPPDLADEYSSSSSDNDNSVQVNQINAVIPAANNVDDNSDLSSDVDNDDNDPKSIVWSQAADDDFIPRFCDIPILKMPTISPDICSTSNPLQVFLKVFPKSLILYLAQCTSERIRKVKEKKKIKIRKPGQILEKC